MKGYGLCYHKECTFQPLGWDFVVETDNKVFNPVVATSDKKQKKSGNRVTNFTKDEFKQASPGSNVTQAARPRTRERKPEPGLKTSIDVTDGVVNRAVADRMLEMFKLYTVCLTEAVVVTAEVQTELDDRADVRKLEEDSNRIRVKGDIESLSGGKKTMGNKATADTLGN